MTTNQLSFNVPRLCFMGHSMVSHLVLTTTLRSYHGVFKDEETEAWELLWFSKAVTATRGKTDRNTGDSAS